MKKSAILISITLITLILLVFGFKNYNNSETDRAETKIGEDIASNTQVSEKIKEKVLTDFIYDVGPRFNPIKKGDLDKAKSFADFIGEEHAQRIVSYKSLSVIILDDDQITDVKETGNSGVFNAAQIEFLQSLDYSTNILIWADYTENNEKTGKLEENHWTPYLTIVPEKQAEFTNGKEALIEYLQEGIKIYTTFIQPDQLQVAKLYFTVTQKGNIKNVKLDRSSNFPEIDKKIIELITNTPGKWKSAENSKGEKVDQELVISYGSMGC